MQQYCIHENPGHPCDDVRCDYCPFRYTSEATASTDDYVAKPVNIDFTGWPDHLPIKEGHFGDPVSHPHHYARWRMEPVQFIAINDLPWWLANVIKYTMRYDAKDGIKDLYKARSYLDMKIRQLEGHTRFWDKPVSEERLLSHELHDATETSGC